MEIPLDVLKREILKFSQQVTISAHK